MRTANDAVETSVAGIFCRLFEGRHGTLSTTFARGILGIRFSSEDHARMEELAQKNQFGQISAKKKKELANYVEVGDLLAILQSKARRALKHGKAESRRHG
jgi:hypothetical protein